MYSFFKISKLAAKRYSENITVHEKLYAKNMFLKLCFVNNMFIHITLALFHIIKLFTHIYICIYVSYSWPKLVELILEYPGGNISLTNS